MSRPREAFGPLGPLADERTTLAWERTGASMIAAGLLLARFGVSERSPLACVAGSGAVGLGAFLMTWASYDGRRRRRRRHDGEGLLHPAVAFGVGIATTLLATLSAVACVAVALR